MPSTAENVHRARNRVSKLQVTESTHDLEDKYNKWEDRWEDNADLNDIDAYGSEDLLRISI